MRRVIVGTAGHIDHGKTALIRALTGVDTDRLPEEKARGITIDLGFAPLDLEGGVRLGVVDVPGHERLVRTMVAGATGIDLLLLVVAADEGVMPQTREHVAICDLLGITRGVVALTKTDVAEEGLAELAAEEVAALLAETGLAGAEIVPVSAQTGEGVSALRQRIRELAGYENQGEGAFTARRRHIEALRRAAAHFATGRQALEETKAGELLAEELRLSQKALGEITGAFSADDLLGKIFSEFCIGK